MMLNFVEVCSTTGKQCLQQHTVAKKSVVTLPILFHKIFSLELQKINVYLQFQKEPITSIFLFATLYEHLFTIFHEHSDGTKLFFPLSLRINILQLYAILFFRMNKVKQ